MPPLVTHHRAVQNLGHTRTPLSTLLTRWRLSYATTCHCWTAGQPCVRAADDLRQQDT